MCTNEKILGECFGQFGHIRGKKRQWLGNFSEQRDLHFFSVEKDFLKLQGEAYILAVFLTIKIYN